MDKKKYIHVLKNPGVILQEDNPDFKGIIQQYPYFQSARALQLKILKNKDSFKYNNELKITAAHTTDRSVLFDFITSNSFKETSILKEKKASLKELFLPNKKGVHIIKEDLAIGKPLAFTKDESFSFNQWLQLSSKNVITRDNTPNKKEVGVPENLAKNEIIDRFIEKSPKISRPSKTNPPEIKTQENKQNSQLATETLAKVYLEQKKYESAIQAYKILSLKYPEKSGFFADQIKRIQILQKNK